MDIQDEPADSSIDTVEENPEIKFGRMEQASCPRNSSVNMNGQGSTSGREHKSTEVFETDSIMVKESTEKRSMENENPLSTLGKANIIELSGLGRPFKLGMLYDCRNDQLISEVSLWDESSLKTVFTPKPNSAYDVIAEDSLSTKLQSLGVEPNLSLSVLSGLVSVPEVENYLNDRKSAKNARVTLKYDTTSHFEEIQMEKLDVSSIQHSELLSQATHIVTGILYGAEAFFVFDREVTQVRNYKEVQINLESLVYLIPGICGTKGRGNAKLTKQDEEEIKNFRCSFYSSSSVLKNNNPTTFQDAVEVCRGFTQHFAEGGNNFLPKKIFLFPLNKLYKDAACMVRLCSNTDLVTQFHHYIDDLHAIETRCNELLAATVCKYFLNLEKHLSNFIEMIKEYRGELIGQFAGMLPRIRGGSSEEEELTELMQNLQQSPFNSKSLNTWLDGKCEEIRLLTQYFNILKDTPGIQLPFDPEEITIVNDFKYDQVVCFEFKVVNNIEKFLNYMRIFLREPNITQDFYSSPPNPWFKNKIIIQDVRQKIKQFVSFAESNESNEKAKFIVSESNGNDNNTQNGIGAVILLYENGLATEFEPPGQPGRPTETEVTHESVKLEWKMPEYGKNNIQCYSVLYRPLNNQQWNIQKTNATETFIFIKNLSPDTEFVFAVRAECSFGSGEESKLSQIIRTKPSPINMPLQKIIAKSNIIDKGPPLLIYKLKLEQIFASKNVAKMEFGTATHPPKPNRVLMLVGATGAGKSTLINGIANYILGVEWKHKFRFKLIADEVNKSQAHSQTQLVTAYTFYWHPGSPLNYTLTVIDTPGFGGTEGLERDHKIMDDIREFFSIEGEDGIDVLDGIGFVTQASLARLTLTQKYISDSILSIFGKDVKNNIFIMVTFADDADPPVMGAIKEADIPYAEFFRFNNSALFENPSNSEFCYMFWKMGYSSFEKFFWNFGRADTVSLILSRKVLEGREKLQIIVQEGIQPQILAGLSKIIEIRQEKQALESRQADILANKDFKFDVIVPKYKKIDCPKGAFITNCNVCEYTCHANCKYEDNSEKWRCNSMEGNEDDAVCQVCPKRCSWREHYNADFRYELSEEVVTRTSQDFFKRFQCQSSTFKKDKLMLIITKMEEELNKMCDEVLQNIMKASELLQRIDEIALKPNPSLTEVEYIDLLIITEKQQKYLRWEERCKYLHEVRKNAVLLSNVCIRDQVDAIQCMNPEKKWDLFGGWSEK